jgi:hypothetical protein
MKKNFEIDIRDPRSRDWYSRFKISRTLFEISSFEIILIISRLKISRFFSHLEINLEKPFSRLPLYLEIYFPFRSEKIHYSRSYFNLETRNLEIFLPSRDKSRKTVLEIVNLEILNLGSKKIRFVSWSNSPSQDFRISI